MTYNFAPGTWSSTAGVFARVTDHTLADTAVDIRTYRGAWKTGLTIEPNGTVTTPLQPHWYGSPTNTTGAGIANAGVTDTHYSQGNITAGVINGTYRIIAPSAGVYLLTLCTISDSSANNRRDAVILVNGVSVLNMLTQTDTSGYGYRGGSVSVYLAKDDYVTFSNQQWYSYASGALDKWRTASVTKLG
jgi:hypothetical protein